MNHQEAWFCIHHIEDIFKKYKTLGYVPISPSARRPPWGRFFPILLSEVEQEQRPSGNGYREAIVVGAGLCDGEGERAYTAYAPHNIFASRTNVFSFLEDVSATNTFRRHFVAETSRVHPPPPKKKKDRTLSQKSEMTYQRANLFTFSVLISSSQHTTQDNKTKT